MILNYDVKLEKYYVTELPFQTVGALLWVSYNGDREWSEEVISSTFNDREHTNNEDVITGTFIVVTTEIYQLPKGEMLTKWKL